KSIGDISTIFIRGLIFAGARIDDFHARCNHASSDAFGEIPQNFFFRNLPKATSYLLALVVSTEARINDNSFTSQLRPCIAHAFPLFDVVSRPAGNASSQQAERANSGRAADTILLQTVVYLVFQQCIMGERAEMAIDTRHVEAELLQLFLQLRNIITN